MEPLKFLRELFGHCPPELWVYLWLLHPLLKNQPKRLSTSCWAKVDDLGQLASRAIAANERDDVYVGVALASKAGTERQRCKSDDAAGIVGLWIDVDFGPTGHKKENLPPTAEDARAIVDGLGLPPSLIVHSGHGLQPWWLFAEPWIFADDDYRKRAQELAKGWNQRLRDTSKARGWDADSVGDLARVLRVPGTTNHKGTPVPVTVEYRPHRYGLADFSPAQRHDEPLIEHRESPEVVVIAPVNTSAGRNPPAEKMAEMLKNRRFKASWERTRDDLHDSSASGYDMALANATAAAGWTDQEITDLLMAAHRKHGDTRQHDDKYYRITLENARKTPAQERITPAQIRDLEAAMAEVYGIDAADKNCIAAGRQEILRRVSSTLGIKVLKIVRYIAPDPFFRVELECGLVPLGSVHVILNQGHFIAAVAAHAKVVIRKKKGPWATVAQALLAACEDEDLGDVSTEEGTIRMWLTEYLETKTQSREKNGREPFHLDKHIAFYLPSFVVWLKNFNGSAPTAQKLAGMLKLIGAVQSRHRIDESQLRVWVLPDVPDVPDVSVPDGFSSGTGEPIGG